ncbi:uncharacterized protein LOC144110073 [Amblyomma americanum]
MHVAKLLIVLLTAICVKASCEEDRANYTVFYDVGTEGEATRFPCLQCFGMPCVDEREKKMTPLGGSKKFCCKRCSHLARPGSRCRLKRDEPAVVCKKGYICSVKRKICVEECPVPDMP